MWRAGVCPGVRNVAGFCLLGRRGVEEIGGLTFGAGLWCCSWGVVSWDRREEVRSLGGCEWGEEGF